MRDVWLEQRIKQLIREMDSGNDCQFGAIPNYPLLSGFCRPWDTSYIAVLWLGELINCLI